MIIDKHLLQLKKEFGKYGSWALWDKGGGITSFINGNDFESLIKPNIIFVGLNANGKLRKDWINYHSECCEPGRVESCWKRTHARKLADVLREKEFDALRGAYMTDIIKDHYDANSGVVASEIKKDAGLITKNLTLFENELEILSKISGSAEFRIICMGNKSFEILNPISKYKTDKVWHYAAYQLGWEGVKERIRQDLRKII